MNDIENKAAAGKTAADKISTGLIIHELRQFEDFPDWITPDELSKFLHESLKPYEDPLPVIKQGISDALKSQIGLPGFVLIGEIDKKVVGALIMLRTGMKKYVPENLLLMVAVNPITRGKGVGSKIIKHAFKLADGDVKLHVEYNNPAKRLYERLGMTNKYAEMRYHK